MREAGSQELLELLTRHAAELDVRYARQALRNPHGGREVIEMLLELPELLVSHELRRDLAAHPATPQAQAIDLVATLFWRDLVRLGADARVPPVVRRAADRQVAARLPGLAVGEKIAIARTAGPGVLARLRRDPSPRVTEAMLGNPRLTEGTLLPLATDERAPAPVLETLARDPRWGVRYPVRLALAGNPATPPAAALAILPHLKKRDLRRLVRDVRISGMVKRRARLLLGEG